MAAGRLRGNLCDNKKNEINVEHISGALTLLTGHCAGEIHHQQYNFENKI